jgi:hypothetical protein
MTDNRRRNYNLEQAKVGDLVEVYRRGSDAREYYHIARLTRTRIVLANGEQFNAAFHSKIGQRGEVNKTRLCCIVME